MYLIVSIFAVTLALHYLSLWIRSKDKCKKGGGARVSYLSKIIDYVFGVLLRQGRPKSWIKIFNFVIKNVLHFNFNAAKASCFSGRHSTMLKIIASVWCLAVLVITTYYAADLTSYITVPTYKPLIKSIYELPGRRDLDLITDKGTNADSVLIVLLVT